MFLERARGNGRDPGCGSSRAVREDHCVYGGGEAHAPLRQGAGCPGRLLDKCSVKTINMFSLRILFEKSLNLSHGYNC